jgi:uncharacterized protein YerC
MEAAVNIASILIDKGAILLSPACASFDMFDDLCGIELQTLNNRMCRAHIIQYHIHSRKLF